MVAIVTRDEVKELEQITSDTSDSLIDVLIPIVEDDLLVHLNNNFKDSNGVINYPIALKLYVAKMINYRLKKQTNDIKSESFSDYSVTYSDDSSQTIAGYPKDIMLGLEKWRKLKWV